MAAVATGYAGSPFETKRTALRAVAIGEDGAFEGYASLFGLRDTCGDIVAPGAFAASLRRRGASGVKMLWQHRPDEPIGVWIEIGEDARGLKVRGRLDVSVARAREALSLIRAGALDGLSIGFRTLRAARGHDGERRLLEIDLIEISIVTFPALPQARIALATSHRRAIAPVSARRDLIRLEMRAAAARVERVLRRLSTMRGGGAHDLRRSQSQALG